MEGDVGALKTQTGWNGRNSSGMSILPAGRRLLSGDFFDIDNYAFYWVQNEYPTNSLVYHLSTDNSWAGVAVDSRSAFSVRCVRD